MSGTIAPSPVFRIVRTGQGMGGFMAPPGHPDHFYEVRGYWPRGDRAVNVARRREADSCSSVSSVVADEYSEYPEHVKDRAKKILDSAELTCSEAWVRSVYGYFRNSYSPDGTDRNVSHAISTNKLRCLCGEEFWNHKGLDAHLNTGNAPGHFCRTCAEHHLGYLCVRGYFPDHQPRADLITDPGKGYGSWPCAKCGQRVQYEARKDAYCVISTQPWSYNPDCPEGGQHEVSQD